MATLTVADLKVIPPLFRITWWSPPDNAIYGKVGKQVAPVFKIIPSYDTEDRFGYHYWMRGEWHWSASYMTLDEAKAKAQSDAPVFA